MTTGSFINRGLFLCIAVLATFVSGWDINNENDRHGCQTYSKNPLDGCDQQRTVYVDLVSSYSKFKTIQSGEYINLALVIRELMAMFSCCFITE